MHSTILLHVAAILNYNLAPITPNRRSRPDIDIFSNNHIPGNCCLWVNKGAFVDDRAVVVEFVNHDWLFVIGVLAINHGCEIIRELVD